MWKMLGESWRIGYLPPLPLQFCANTEVAKGENEMLLGLKQHYLPKSKKLSSLGGVATEKENTDFPGLQINPS